MPRAAADAEAEDAAPDVRRPPKSKPRFELPVDVDDDEDEAADDPEAKARRASRPDDPVVTPLLVP